MRDAGVAKKAIECERISEERRNEETIDPPPAPEISIRIIKLPPSPAQRYIGGCIRQLLGLQKGHHRQKHLSVQFVSL
jgi:hypothetical protein